MKDDIIGEYEMRVLRALATGLAPAQALRVTSESMRRDYGGDRAYIPKAPSLGKEQRLSEILASGSGFAEACRQAGVGRSWGYTLVHRRRVVGG